jgi:hypothetical protein
MLMPIPTTGTFGSPVLLDGLLSTIECACVCSAPAPGDGGIR